MMKKWKAFSLVILCWFGILAFSAVGFAAVPSDAKTFGGHAYKLYDIPCKWTEAEQACEARGGHLVTVNSKEEHEFLKTMMTGMINRYCWIGGRIVSGKWAWVTGEPWNYTDWSPDQPNGSGGGGYALMQHYTGNPKPWNWDDQNNTGKSPSSKWSSKPYYQTTSSYFYICEWENQSIPSTPITKLVDEGSGNLRIYWRSQGNLVSGYQIRWSTDKTFKKGTKTASYSGINNVTRSGLQVGSTYYVGVRTYVDVNGTRRYSTWSGTKSVKLSLKLTAPRIKAMKMYNKGFQIFWDKVSGVNGYQIRWSKNQNFTGSSTASINGAGTTTYKRVVGIGTWYISIRSYMNRGDGTRYYSPWSNTARIRIK